jgi:hypothetical protein
MQIQSYDIKARSRYSEKRHCERAIHLDIRTAAKVERWLPRNEQKHAGGKWHIDRTSRRRIEPTSGKVFVVEDRFLELAKNWKKETAMFSVIRDKMIDSNYLEIIGLGRTFKEPILKLILKDLEKREEFWHYALKTISDVNPVPKGMVNNLSVVRECWLQWGRDQKLI